MPLSFDSPVETNQTRLSIRLTKLYPNHPSRGTVSFADKSVIRGQRCPGSTVQWPVGQGFRPSSMQLPPEDSLTNLDYLLEQAVGGDALVALRREHVHCGAREVFDEHAASPLRPRLQGLPNGQGAELRRRERGEFQTTLNS